ncbi:MAG: universal stress protein [Acidobacteriota bacterium]
MDLKKIVVGTDFSDHSLPALEAAFQLALESGATLYLVHAVEAPAVIGIPAVPVHEPFKELHDQARQRLDALIPQNSRRDLVAKPVVLAGEPAAEIAQLAREKNADMIIVGTHGRAGLVRVFMGSTAVLAMALQQLRGRPLPSKLRVAGSSVLDELRSQVLLQTDFSGDHFSSDPAVIRIEWVLLPLWAEYDFEDSMGRVRAHPHLGYRYQIHRRIAHRFAQPARFN